MYTERPPSWGKSERPWEEVTYNLHLSLSLTDFFCKGPEVDCFRPYDFCLNRVAAWLEGKAVVDPS
jgi:hypothetical protein